MKKILLKLGFQDSWLALIMKCITTVSYSILVNGESKGMITPLRVLRQGDPVSPYLSLFYAGGLNALFRNTATEGEIQGFPTCRNIQKLTHLFFTDDFLLFCRSTFEKCEKIQDLLAYYEVASGQMKNKGKTTLFFSGNMDERTQEATKVSLNARTIQHYEKFLGLPSFVGKDKKACITQVKERIW